MVIIVAYFCLDTILGFDFVRSCSGASGYHCCLLLFGHKILGFDFVLSCSGTSGYHCCLLLFGHNFRF